MLDKERRETESKTYKRFLVFVCSRHGRSGALHDCEASFDTRAQAMSFVATVLTEDRIDLHDITIFDCDERDVVYRIEVTTPY